MDNRDDQILVFLQKKGAASSREIFDELDVDYSYATLKRLLVDLTEQGLVQAVGRGKATKYEISPIYQLLRPIDLAAYFKDEIDERAIIETFNTQLIRDTLLSVSVFTQAEVQKLHQLHAQYRKNIAELSESAYKKELERLAIDLSWKSSQIEGNTYTLLETERLLLEKQTATGKTKEEAVMLLNHKDALDFIIEHPDYLSPLTVSKIEDIHSLLTKELTIERNVRTRRVGISGTNYRPLDNEYQIRESLRDMCGVINGKAETFEKALLALVLISYIQPFADGNKRTARIVSNALLMDADYCPLSFRTIDSIEYKKAMLLFYEQNNISSFKEIFIQQYEFAVKTYF